MQFLKQPVKISGVVPVCGCWSRQDVRGRFGAKHSLVDQLLGVPAEEALAERSFHQHQDHDGQTSAPVLKRCMSPTVDNKLVDLCAQKSFVLYFNHLAVSADLFFVDQRKNER